MRGRPRLTQIPLSDWALGGVGFSMATASASFAAYMITTAPSQVVDTGSRDFGVFVHWDRRTPGIVTHGPSQTPREGQAVAALSPPASAQDPSPATPAAPAEASIAPPATAALPAAAAGTGLDMTPVGTVPAGAGSSTAPPRTSSKSLHDFRVRGVFGDTVLIEHRSTLSLVKAGSVLAGAGEVLSIERRGDGWIVRTAQGTIGGT